MNQRTAALAGVAAMISSGLDLPHLSRVAPSIWFGRPRPRPLHGPAITTGNQIRINSERANLRSQMRLLGISGGRQKKRLRRELRRAGMVGE